jgi:uncharacterized RDD family membrane protein YckC
MQANKMPAQVPIPATPATDKQSEDRGGAGQAMAGDYAGFVSRLVAFVVDHAVILAVAGLVTIVGAFLKGLVPEGWPLGRLTALLITASIIAINVGVYLAYLIGFTVLAGQTPGKRLMGLRVVSTDGGPVRLGQAVRRVIGYWLAWILLLGYLMILIDDRRQGLQDKLAKTLVVYAPLEDTGVRPVMAAGDRLRRWAKRGSASQDDAGQRTGSAAGVK